LKSIASRQRRRLSRGREYYEIDLTITPRPPTGSFQHWDIDDLMLVRPGLRWNEADDDVCQVTSVNVIREGTVLLDKPADNKPADQDENENEDDDGPKVVGPQRLKMLIGVKPEIRALVFKYYFETFGSLNLPA